MICCSRPKDEHEESGMYFCPLFNSNHITTFYIEKDDLYRNVGEGVKVVEFVSLKGNKLLFIEAKESGPKKTEIDKPTKIYEEPEPYNENNLEEFFLDWSADDFENWTKWRVKQDKFDKFSQNLYDKMNHSLNLIATKELELPKHASYSLPNELKSLISKKKISFVLIINEILDKNDPKYDAKVATYAGITAALDSKFLPLKGIWGIDINIYHKEQARKKGFIV